MDVPHMLISTPERHEGTGFVIDVTNVPSPNPRCADSVFANVIPTNSITHDTLTVQIHPTNDAGGRCPTRCADASCG